MAGTTVSALGNAIAGLRQQQQRVAGDTQSLNAALVAAQNRQAALTGNGQVVPAPAPLSDPTLAAAQTPDIVTPIVDILQARHAYAANAAALRVTADVEQTTVDRLGHRSA
jgi:hypothetical protein